MNHPGELPPDQRDVLNEFGRLYNYGTDPESKARNQKALALWPRIKSTGAVEVLTSGEIGWLNRHGIDVKND